MKIENLTSKKKKEFLLLFKFLFSLKKLFVKRLIKNWLIKLLTNLKEIEISTQKHIYNIEEYLKMVTCDKYDKIIYLLI